MLARTYAPLIALALTLGCDGSDALPGTITVDVSGVVGAEGKLLIAEAVDTNGNQAAILCVPIDADPFGLEAPLEAIVGPTPCEESEPIDLPAGTYDLTIVTMQGGSQSPDSCATTTAEVDGPITVTVPELGACGGE